MVHRRPGQARSAGLRSTRIEAGERESRSSEEAEQHRQAEHDRQGGQRLLAAAAASSLKSVPSR